MQPLSFWYDCIGQRIAPDLPPEKSTKVALATHMKKGIGPNPLGGGISAFYIAQPNESFLIGKFAENDKPGLKFISSESMSGEKQIARWLIDQAPLDKPWMIGVIGNANPTESLRISQPPALCAFGEVNGGFEFNLTSVREAVKLMGDTPWKKDVAPAIHAYEGKLKAAATGLPHLIEKANEKLDKMFKKNPAIRPLLVALIKLPIKPNSGEYQVLSWYNRER